MNDIRLIRVAGIQALAELERLRHEYATTGAYPILFGDQREYESLQESREASFAQGMTFDSILRESHTIDAREWIEGRIAEYVDIEDRESDDWPTDPTEELGIITHTDLQSGMPKGEVLIGLLNVHRPWQAFAELLWGGWNDCPFPSEQCAIHRYWEQEYGAEVVSVTADVVQCVLSRPPSNRAQALRLAREQYAYCCEIVEQGTGTITTLAAGLIDSPYWYFWWD